MNFAVHVRDPAGALLVPGCDLARYCQEVAGLSRAFYRNVNT